MIETAPNTTVPSIAAPSIAAPSIAAPSIAATGEAVSLADCQALMVCLAGGRFVIVRVDEEAAPGLTCAVKPDLRDLMTGDVVAYRGRNCTVQAVEIYR